jgi:hypothetical protein
MKKYNGLDEFGEWVAAILNIEPEEILVEAAEVEDMNPNGTSYVPYSFDTDYVHNFTFSNFTFNFTNATNITWVNGTEPPDRRALLGHASDSMRRQLGLEFDVKPFIPSVEISADYFSVMYALGYFSGDMYHTIEMKGMGCYAKVICFVGAIHATIKLDSMNKNDYGGYVAVEVDFDGKVTFEVIKLRYDYLGGNTDYSGYIFSKGTHLAAVEATVDALNQYRGSAGIEAVMAKKKVSKSDPKYVRYNGGMMSIFAKTEYFEGVGFLGAGKWKLHKSWTYPLKHWGTPSSEAIANCVGNAFVDLPVNTWLTRDWSKRVGDVYEIMASDGHFYIKLKLDDKIEVLWKKEHPPPPVADYSYLYYARLSYNSEVSPIATFGIYRYLGYWADLATSIQLDLSTCSQCRYSPSEGGYCPDQYGVNFFFSPIGMGRVAKSPGKIRWRLYGDGNLKIECTYVETLAGYFGVSYKELWKTAWESGVRGTCAVKAAS